MARLLVSIFLSSFVFFGAMSKNLLASELLNHLKTEHVNHEHRSDKTQENHSHSFEMFQLTLSLNLFSPQGLSIAVKPFLADLKIESYVTDLNICHFSSTVFRPPIV
jgi:hypothetical protein